VNRQILDVLLIAAALVCIAVWPLPSVCLLLIFLGLALD
jgi:hypothetical protein